MRLARFQCRNFRSLADLDFDPAGGINIIRGHNAQGKTSVLEAILFAATSKSHRTNTESELVRYGEPGFRLSAMAARADRDVTVDAFWHDGVKRFKVNGIAQSRISEILGKISVVLFSPEDIELVKGAAACRRKFLDMELAQISPNYLNALQRYRQALRQRNQLLRGYEPEGRLLDVWDAQIAEHGAVLIEERGQFVRQLARFAAEAHGQITDGEELGLDYAPDVPGGDLRSSGASLSEILVKTRASDIRRQTTTRGPHRDDMEIGIARKPARVYASQGQQKTAALALKLAELALIRERTGEFPVLMLDEVLSELDENRARQLFLAVPNEVQCLITTTSVARGENLSNAGFTGFYIEQGNLRRE